MNKSKLVRRNSYDDLTPLYKPTLQFEAAATDNTDNNTNATTTNNNDSLVIKDKPIASQQENGLSDLYDFNDLLLDDQLMIASQGNRSNGLHGQDDDTDEGKKNIFFLHLFA